MEVIIKSVNTIEHGKSAYECILQEHECKVCGAVLSSADQLSDHVVDTHDKDRTQQQQQEL